MDSTYFYISSYYFIPLNTFFCEVSHLIFQLGGRFELRTAYRSSISYTHFQQFAITHLANGSLYQTQLVEVQSLLSGYLLVSKCLFHHSIAERLNRYLIHGSFICAVLRLNLLHYKVERYVKRTAYWDYICVNFVLDLRVFWLYWHLYWRQADLWTWNFLLTVDFCQCTLECIVTVGTCFTVFLHVTLDDTTQVTEGRYG